jgi:GT2 family glycosyltransferase
MLTGDVIASETTSTAVVIPHLNRLADTAACYRSLTEQTNPPGAIFIVDNGSTDHAEAELDAACPRATVIRLQANVGFAGAVNVGIHQALETPSVTFIWVLNNDTLCPPDTLARLLAAATSDRRIGLVGSPLVEDQGGRRRAIPPGKRLLLPWLIPTQVKPGAVPDYLSGASLLIRRALVETIGSFDDGFFFFFEDVDFSLRAKAHGWRLAVADAAPVQHTGSATIGALGELQARYYRAGHVRLLRRYSRHPLAAALPPLCFRLLADALRLRFAALRGTLKGWHEGWHASLEPMPRGAPSA